jgi:hypothetical protein
LTPTIHFQKGNNLKKIFAFTLFLTTLTIQSQSVRKYSNEFMNIGVDAAALGMSNTTIAQTNDANATYWNPAGLIGLKDKQIALMHASYFANIAQYDFAAYAAPIDSQSAWGISMIRFGVDNIMNTTQLIDNQGNIDYNRVSLFSAADYGFTFSYARTTGIPGLHYGANTKVIRRIIGDFANSWGFGFDAGIQYDRNNWNFGLMVRDITTTYNTWSIDKEAFKTIQNTSTTQNQTLPETEEITLPKAQLGVAKRFTFKNETHLLVASNINMRFAQTHDIYSSKTLSIDPALGLEYDYKTMVFVRAGVGNFQNTVQIDGTKEVAFQPNMGLGFKYKGIQIDYALTDLGDQSNALYSNVFSVKIYLNIFK